MDQCTQCGHPMPAAGPCLTCGARPNPGPSFQPHSATQAPPPVAQYPPPQPTFSAPAQPTAAQPLPGYASQPEAFNYGPPPPPAPVRSPYPASPYPPGAFAPTAPKSGGAWVAIVVAVALVLGVGGFIGLRVMSRGSSGASGQGVPQVVKHIALTVPPVYVAAAPNGNVYVSHFGGQPLSVIVNDRVISRFLVGASYGNVVVAPDNSVYATDHDAGTVVAFKDHERVGPLVVGGGPYLLAADGKGDVYVSQADAGTVGVVSGMRLVTRIKVGGHPGAITAAPDGTVYVADYDKGVVTVIKNRKVTTKFALSGGPGFMGVTSDGTLYVGLKDCKLAVVKKAVVTATVALGSCDEDPELAVGPDDRVYATLARASGNGELVVVNGTTVTGRVALGSRPYGVAVTREGIVYVAENGNNRLAVLR